MFNKLSSLFKYNISNSPFCFKQTKSYGNHISTPFKFNFGRNIHSLSLFNTHISSFYKTKSFHTHLYNDCRNISFHKPRRQIGHKFEFIIGKHKRAKVNPPRVPIHPTKDVDKDMNLFETYRDLKLRWKKTTKSRKNKVKIARKWRQPYYFNPTNQPTCMFVLHENLPRTRNDKVYYKEDEKEYVPLKIELDESHNFDVYPPESVVDDLKNKKVETFCIFKSSPIHQHKVTKGDIVQIERLKRRKAGDKVTFGTVLLVGSKYWTIIGKPTVPYAKVEATIEQQTLCGDQLSFKYRKSRRISRFLRVRHWVTVLRIDNIVVDPSMEINTEHKASRLLDLWSNRWLYTEELEGLNKTMDISQEIYDGSEHQPGYYNDMGLSESYRWYPDPYAKRGIK